MKLNRENYLLFFAALLAAGFLATLAVFGAAEPAVARLASCGVAARRIIALVSRDARAFEIIPRLAALFTWLTVADALTGVLALTAFFIAVRWCRFRTVFVRLTRSAFLAELVRGMGFLYVTSWRQATR
mgnify:CR=1 FL=1